MPGVAVRNSRIDQLKSAVAAGHTDVLDEFWESVARDGAPLIEQQVPGGDDRARVTFVWRGSPATRNVVVVSGVAGYDFATNRMHRVQGTDVWARTYLVPRSTRTTYWLSENDSLQPVRDVTDWPARASTWRSDPLNPRIFTVGDAQDSLTWSILELPDAPRPDWLEPRPGIATGQVRRHDFKSEPGSTARPVWLYTPARGTSSGGDNNLLVLLDGGAYLDPIPTPTILDNLIAEGQIAPTIAVLVESAHPGTRTQELTDFESLARLLADVLVPWVRERCTATSDPSRIVIGGSSLGGLAAAVVAMRRPDVFGCVLSQSGAYWWSPKGDNRPHVPAIERELSPETVKQLRFYLEAGLFEAEGIDGDALAANRGFRDWLLQAGARICYSEFAGGHDYLCWRASLADGLIHLLGNGDGGTATSRASQEL